MAPCLLFIGLACGGEASRVEDSSPAVAPPACSLTAPIASLTLIEARPGVAAVVRCPGGGLATIHTGELVGPERGTIAMISGDAVAIERPLGGAERWVLRAGGASSNFHLSGVAPPQPIQTAVMAPGNEEGGTP